jgi:hypothetical protein
MNRIDHIVDQMLIWLVYGCATIAAAGLIGLLARVYGL